MATEISTIRSRIQTAVNAMAGMSVSIHPYERFSSTPNTIAHLRFACGVVGVEGRPDDRQRQAQGILADTSIGIRFTYRIRPKDQVTSYDEAWDKATDIAQTVTNRSPTIYSDIQIRFSRMTHEVLTSGEFIIITLFFQILHYIPLV